VEKAQIRGKGGEKVYKTPLNEKEASREKKCCLEKNIKTIKGKTEERRQKEGKTNPPNLHCDLGGNSGGKVFEKKEELKRG